MADTNNPNTQNEDAASVSTTAIEVKKEKEEKCGKCLELRLDFIKWIFGVLFLGISGQLISWNYNSSQLAIQKHETDSKLITSISLKFDTEPTIQLSYLKFIAPFVTSGDLKVAINHSIDSLSRSTVPRYITVIAKSDARKSATATVPKLNNSEIAKFKADAKVDTNSIPKPANVPMSEAVKQESAVIAGNKNIIPSIDANVIKNIQDGSSLLNPNKVDNYQILGTPVTLWCKKGYYVVFNGTISIGVNNIDLENQMISVITKSYDDEKRILNLKQLSVGITETLDDKEYRYLITLNNIGAAGFNPFTKAAYITVVTYKKQ